MPLAPLVGSGAAATIARSHWWPLVMNVLEPLRIQSSPSRTAMLLRAARSDPPDGSGHADGEDLLAGGDAGQPAGLLPAVPRWTMGAQMSAWMPKHEAAEAWNSRSPRRTRR